MPGVAPSGILTEAEHDVVVVTVQTAPRAPRTFHGLLAFAVDLGAAYATLTSCHLALAGVHGE